MTATPEAPMSLLVMLLERCTEQVKEYLRAQQFPDAQPNPNWDGPLMPGPSAEESPPGAAREPRPGTAREAAPGSEEPEEPRTLTSPRTSAPAGSRRSRTSAPASADPSTSGPSAPTPPEHYIPAPVGERHHRRIPQDVKIAVAARDGGRCRQCGSTAKLHFDHIIPVSKGGANTIANIQLLCGPCNRSKAAKYAK